MTRQSNVVDQLRSRLHVIELLACGMTGITLPLEEIADALSFALNDVLAGLLDDRQEARAHG